MSKVRLHRVMPGETLTTIAEQYYGCRDSTKHALIIWQHNRDHVADPNQIYPGQQLVIPHLPSHMLAVSW